MPAAGALTLLETMPTYVGGCAANVAIDLAKQGISVGLTGCVGADGPGDMLVCLLKAGHVLTKGVARLEKQPTSRTIVLLIEGDDRRYLHLVGANASFSVDHISREWLRGLKVFYLGGLFALPGLDLRRLAVLLTHCRTIGVTTVVDVAIGDDQTGMDALAPLLPLIDVFLPNDDEARIFTGLTDPVDQLREFQRHGARKVIITRGGSGALALDDGKLWSCGAYSMNVIDPSGSGDAFASGVIRGLLGAWDMAKVLRYASALGASATRAIGTTQSVFSAAEADEFVQSHPIRVTHAS
jgi:sugar/nucleoside kinase (ribokinase family)